jgi:hypothetical protein
MKLLPFERRWAAVALDSVLPPGPGDLPGARGVPATELLDDVLGLAPFRTAASLRLLFLCVQLVPLVVARRPTLLAHLPATDRAEIVRRWSAHPSYVLRQMGLLLKTLGGLAYLGDPGVQRALGYESPGQRSPVGPVRP